MVKKKKKQYFIFKIRNMKRKMYKFRALFMITLINLLINSSILAQAPEFVIDILEKEKLEILENPSRALFS